MFILRWIGLDWAEESRPRSRHPTPFAQNGKYFKDLRWLLGSPSPNGTPNTVKKLVQLQWDAWVPTPHKWPSRPHIQEAETASTKLGCSNSGASIKVVRYLLHSAGRAMDTLPKNFEAPFTFSLAMNLLLGSSFSNFQTWPKTMWETRVKRPGTSPVPPYRPDSFRGSQRLMCHDFEAIREVKSAPPSRLVMAICIYITKYLLMGVCPLRESIYI